MFTPLFDDRSAAQPFLPTSSQTPNSFLISILLIYELMDRFMAGRDQSAADQPNILAEAHSEL
jgi:hypothetical protein